MEKAAQHVLDKDVIVHFVQTDLELTAVLESPKNHIAFLKRGNLTIHSAESIFSVHSGTLVLIYGKASLIRAHDKGIMGCYVLSFSESLSDFHLFNNVHKLLTTLSGNVRIFELALPDSEVIGLLFKGLYIARLTDAKPDSFTACVISLILELQQRRYAQWNTTNTSFLSIKCQYAERFLALVKVHYSENHSVQHYADILCVTRGHLTKVMKDTGNKKPKLCINEELVFQSKALLRLNTDTIVTVADILGFTSASSFSTFFKKQVGVTPSAYRNSPDKK